MNTEQKHWRDKILYQIVSVEMQDMAVVKTSVFVADHDFIRIWESILFPQLCLTATRNTLVTFFDKIHMSRW